MLWCFYILVGHLVFLKQFKIFLFFPMFIYHFPDPTSEFSINWSVLQNQKPSGNNAKESLRELGYPQKQQ